VFVLARARRFSLILFYTKLTHACVCVGVFVCAQFFEDFLLYSGVCVRVCVCVCVVVLLCVHRVSMILYRVSMILFYTEVIHAYLLTCSLLLFSSTRCVRMSVFVCACVCTCLCLCLYVCLRVRVVEYDSVLNDTQVL